MKNKKTILFSVGLIGISILTVTLFNFEEINLDIFFDNSEKNSAMSYGQQGGITAGKVEVHQELSWSPEPALSIRRVESLNTKTEGGFRHTYTLSLFNPANLEIAIEARAPHDADFEFKDFNWDYKAWIIEQGRTTADLEASVVTDRKIAADDIDFVIVSSKNTTP